MAPRIDPRLGGFATEMRKDQTRLEAKLWRHLRSSQLGFKFRRQSVIGTYIVDFFCPSIGLIVELDGMTHRAAKDVLRDELLQEKGFTVLRFGNSDVSTGIDRVLNAIFMTARNLPPRFGPLPHPPAPSPEGEGGQQCST